MEKYINTFVAFIDRHLWIAKLWCILWSMILAWAVFNYNFTTSI